MYHHNWPKAASEPAMVPHGSMMFHAVHISAPWPYIVAQVHESQASGASSAQAGRGPAGAEGWSTMSQPFDPQ